VLRASTSPPKWSKKYSALLECVKVAIHKGRYLSSVHTSVSGVSQRTWAPFVFALNSVKCTSLNDS
jgi:hypothetical protein